METKKILIVDDEADIREVLRLLLEQEGYQVFEASCGKEALAMLAQGPDLVVLDVMMPGESGYTVCQTLRQKTNAPVLFLTAKAQEQDKVQGLQSGGDDYLAKPFSGVELKARVHALLRRYHVYQGSPQPQNTEQFVRGAVSVDPQTGAVSKAGQRIPLTDIEQRMLLLLIQHQGQTVDGKTLYEQVWNEIYLLSSASTVMVHIRNLRKKLEDDPQAPVLIKTVWGKGYRID